MRIVYLAPTRLILHSAKAALLSKDIGAEIHAAVKQLFGLHFVQTGSIEPDWGTYLGESSDLRLANNGLESMRLARRAAEVLGSHLLPTSHPCALSCLG